MRPLASCRGRLFPSAGSFQGEQTLLSPASRGVASQSARLGNDAVAGENDQNGVRCHRAPDGAGSGRTAESPSEILVGKSLSPSQRKELVPDGRLPGGADRSDRDGKSSSAACKIFGQLSFDLPKMSVGQGFDGSTQRAAAAFPQCAKPGGVGKLKQPQASGIGEPDDGSQGGIDLPRAEPPVSRSRTDRRRESRCSGFANAFGGDHAGLESLRSRRASLPGPQGNQEAAARRTAHEGRIATLPPSVHGGKRPAEVGRGASDRKTERAGAPPQKTCRQLVKRACQTLVSWQ